MKIVDLLQSLADNKVQYVLVGGLAVQLHGFMRATFDVDLVLAMNDENLLRFIEVAKQHALVPGIPVSIESLRDAAQIDQWHREKGMLAFTLREQRAGGSVVAGLVRPPVPSDRSSRDVLFRPAVTFEGLSRNAVTGMLFGRSVAIASIEDLLVMKQFANRPKDQLDVAALEKIKRGEDPNA